MNKKLVALAAASALIIGGVFGWIATAEQPLTERQKAELTFRDAQDANEEQMRDRCKEPFGPSLTEREERNRTWCVNRGLLDPF
ncbi:hypothetical protein A6R70_14385 [Agrobacterium rubi]|uniref:hypothetical protein n=1 Tax=Agrobacterium rubi TaxID=28099 RepID=UPI00201B9072|nr:hypothetical protein [Agrobacterium rubi]MCL6653477.1 hypothetical protein [Agrobacterium rubi]